jgi:signal transduction histidine kinase/CheY-like chemotaxis protein
MRFRSRLFILVLSVLVPALAASALAVWYVYTEEQKGQERAVGEAARSFALMVGKELETHERMLRAMAAAPSLVNHDIALFAEYARRLAPTRESVIVLNDLAGRQLVNSRAAPGTPLPQRRSSDIQAQMDRGGPNRRYVSNLFWAPVGGNFDFTIQIPLTGWAEPHFLAVGQDVGVLQNLLRDQRFPSNWIGTIVDGNGVVLARTIDPQKFVGKAVRKYTRDVLAAREEGVYSSVSLDGTPVKAFYSRVPGTAWSVLISIPEKEIRNASSRAAAFLAGMLLVVLSFAVLAANLLARRVIEPIERLGVAAGRLAQGQDVTYVPHGVSEIDDVGLRLVDASLQIRDAQAVQERRVREAVSATELAERKLMTSQKLEALGRLTGGIAHEFNNLLQTMSTSLELAGRLSTQERVAALIGTCKKAVVRAGKLTGQLSSFGRMQEGRIETVQPDERIRAAAQLIANVLPGNIVFELELQDGLWPVAVDPLQLELALLNLSLNARDAMPDGGTIALDARNVVRGQPADGLAAGEYVRIALRDTGTGMTPAVLAKAGEPFFTTKELGKGTGLGLAQVFGFARHAGGAVTLASTPGAGTTVAIDLPRTAGVATADAQEATAPAPMSAHGTVLFVEDDALVREAMAPALEAAGFTVHVAGDAQGALDLLEAGTLVDVVFSDVVMPGPIGGIALARLVGERYDGLPVVLATGHTDESAALPGIRVLAKPYRISDVVEAIGAAARRE